MNKPQDLETTYINASLLRDAYYHLLQGKRPEALELINEIRESLQERTIIEAEDFTVISNGTTPEEECPDTQPSPTREPA